MFKHSDRKYLVINVKTQLIKYILQKQKHFISDKYIGKYIKYSFIRYSTQCTYFYRKYILYYSFCSSMILYSVYLYPLYFNRNYDDHCIVLLFIPDAFIQRQNYYICYKIYIAIYNIVIGTISSKHRRIKFVMNELVLSQNHNPQHK